MTRTALITSITMQDGSHLAQLLIARGYEVHGIIRRSSSSPTGRIDLDPSDEGRRVARALLVVIAFVVRSGRVLLNDARDRARAMTVAAAFAIGGIVVRSKVNKVFTVAVAGTYATVVFAAFLATPAPPLEAVLA